MSSYGQYGGKNPDQWSEYWCQLPVKDLKPKGLCQFCNPKTIYYNKKND